MFHKIKVDIGSKTELLVDSIRGFYGSAGRAASGSRCKLTAYLRAGILLSLPDHVFGNILMGVEGHDLLLLKNLQLILIKHLLSLLSLHSPIQMLNNLKHLPIIKLKRHVQLILI